MSDNEEYYDPLAATPTDSLFEEVQLNKSLDYLRKILKYQIQDTYVRNTSKLRKLYENDFLRLREIQ